MNTQPSNVTSIRSRLSGPLAAIDWATGMQTGNPTAKNVLSKMARYVDDENVCWPSQKRLAADTDLSERSVKGAVALLVEVGLVERENRLTKDGRTTSNRYVLRLDRTATKKDFDKAKIRLKSGVQEMHPQSSKALRGAGDAPPTSSTPQGGTRCTPESMGVQEVHGEGAGDAPTGVQEVPPKKTKEEASEEAMADAVASGSADAALLDIDEVPSTKPRKPRGKRALPADWEPNDGHRTFADEHHLDLEEEAAKFKDHALMNDRRLKDWDAGFRNWLRNAIQFRSRDGRDPKNRPNPLAHSKSVEELVRERGY